MNWRLHNIKTRQEIGGLSTEYAVEFLRQYSPEQREDWYAWQEGMTSWQHCSGIDALQLPSVSHVLDPQCPARPEPVVPPPFVRKERRAHERYNFRLKAVIIAGNKTYRGFTKDISVGGLQLDKQVSWSIPGQVCDVFLISPESDERISFKAKVLTDAKNNLRLNFDDSQALYRQQLSDWLDALKNRQLQAA